MSKLQIFNINRNVRRFAMLTQLPMIALVLCVCPSGAPAQDDHSHATAEQHEMTPNQRSSASALLKIVRNATERFKDVAQAEAEGYALQFGCVSGPDSGAMGLHYVNMALVNS